MELEVWHVIVEIHFEYKLKDGRNALIRSPRDEDIQGMLDYLNNTTSHLSGK